MALCTNCGADNPDRAKFCLECGAAMPAAEARSAGARKLVTVLFADVVGSTALGERLDPETMRLALGRYFTAARAVVERHGGTVEKFIGDAVMAVFGIPLLHEDDALRAVRAAVELRDEIARLNEQLSGERRLRVEFRIGVNTGTVVAGGGDGSGSFVTGDAVNVAARLEQAAAAGEVLLGDATYRLVRDHVLVDRISPVAAKGKAGEVGAHRLVGLAGGAAGALAAAERRAPFVGRRRELSRLRESFDGAVAERRCFLFTLLGSAGVGKSRLVAEFLAAAATEATILGGRCLPYGEGITYWPIGEMVRAATGLGEQADAMAMRAAIVEIMAGDASTDRGADLLTSMLGLTTFNAPAEERFWAVRRFVEALARERPLICLIEDIHWAEAAMLDLLENVADWTRDAPILLLCTARPELLEARPTWGGGKVNATTILLEPLNHDATRQLVEALLGQAGLMPGLVDRILDSAEGNPLFAEEIVRMIGEDAATAADGEHVHIPASVQAVIAARLDRLPATERAVAERAAVVGRVFERGAVLELVREDDREGVPTALLSLMRKELVQPSQPDLTSDEAFRFRHMLIRDTAYDAVAKSERAELHERFAGWVERVAGERVDEYAEIVGYHLELAVQYRRELGLVDARTDALAERAGEALRGAGERAYLRGEDMRTVALLERAVELLPPGSARRRILIMIANTSSELRPEPLAVTDRLIDEARAAGDAADEWKGRLLKMRVLAFRDPEFSPSDHLAEVEEALAAFRSAADEHGMAIANDVLCYIYLGLAQWQKSAEYAEAGRQNALAAGDLPLAGDMRVRSLNAALWGSTPAGETLALTNQALADDISASGRSFTLNLRAFAHAMLGYVDEARNDVQESLRIRRELGDPRGAYIFVAAPVEMVLGDNEAAERNVAATIAALEFIGETGQRSTQYGFWARIAFDLGRPDDQVRKYAELCREFAAADDIVSQVQWRAALALVAARGGRIAEAKQLIGEATELIETTDFFYELGLTAEDRGYIHQMAAEVDDARREYEAARRFFEQKGAILDAARVRKRLAAL